MRRRHFMKNFGKVLLAAPVIGTVVSGVAKAAKVELVKTSNATAKALKYAEDASKAKGKKAKQGVAADKQFCNNCNFYKDETDHNGKKVGKCLMLQMKYVPAKAWCNVWTKKA